MTTKELQDRIIALKKETDTCILAHTYQSHEILEVADITGDSFALSRQATKTSNRRLLMCGVRFMAETAKLLAPDRTVLLSSPDAGCPMAEQFTREDILALREKYPDHAVVSYINTTAAIKTVSDVCVTSASALNIVKNLPQNKILFIPDCNLGAYVAEAVPEKEFVFVNGGCPVHAAVTEEEVIRAKKKHPNALFLVHPECKKEVQVLADFVGSTTAIMDFARASKEKEFIIGTENSIVTHLQYECPDKFFYPLSAGLICRDMRLTTLPDVLACLEGKGGEEITLDEKTLVDARRCIDEMIRLG